MESYTEFKYVYPPRPAAKISPDAIQRFEDMGFWAQPKLNGSCSVTFTDKTNLRFMGRHKDNFARELLDRNELKSLHRGKGWMQICGEYMNKSQKDASGKVFNAKLVLWDMPVFDGKHLIGTTFDERQKLMDEVYPVIEPYDKWIDRVGDNVFRVKNLKENFLQAFNEITDIEMYEGFVFKNPKGKLDFGYKEANNTGWQAKCRKPTKNYTY